MHSGVYANKSERLKKAHRYTREIMEKNPDQSYREVLGSVLSVLAFNQKMDFRKHKQFAKRLYNDHTASWTGRSEMLNEFFTKLRVGYCKQTDARPGCLAYPLPLAVRLMTGRETFFVNCFEYNPNAWHVQGSFEDPYGQKSQHPLAAIAIQVGGSAPEMETRREKAALNML